MSSPVFNEQIFNSSQSYAGDAMTVQGAVNKALILTGLCLATATFTWYQIFSHSSAIGGWMILGLVGALISGLVMFFSPKTSPVAAPIYALAEGLLIGAISAIFEARYPGIVFPAVALTMCVLVSVLAAYKARLIQATEKFKAGVIAATMAIFMVYMVSLLVSLFTGHPIPMIHEGGPIGIIFSLVCVVVASMNLVLDFDFIEQGEASGAPKFMEWYSAYGLLVTLLWLYIEILKLLGKLQKR